MSDLSDTILFKPLCDQEITTPIVIIIVCDMSRGC